VTKVVTKSLMPNLTTKKVDSIKADGSDQQIADGQGLVYRVGSNGTRSWLYRYTYTAKRKTVAIGPYPEFSLLAARTRAGEFREMLAKGKDPKDFVQTERANKEASLTVRQLIDDFHDRWLAVHYLGSHEAARSMLKLDLKPIYNVLVPDVTPAHVTTCINKIVERNAKVTANRFLSLVTKMFAFAKAQHMRTDIPITTTRSDAGGKESPKQNNLRFEQLAAVHKLLASPPINVSRAMSWQTATALRLLILTGQRPGEVVRIKWSEIDLENGTWVIPAEFTKAKVKGDHTVHLSTQAVALLNTVKARTDASNVHVFPSPQENYKDQPIRRHSLSETMLALQRADLIEFSFTPHDLRRTFSSRMAELEIAPHVVEKILHHQMIGVMAVYNRYDYFPERKLALQAWGDKTEMLSTD
jgi:integrase